MPCLGALRALHGIRTGLIGVTLLASAGAAAQSTPLLMAPAPGATYVHGRYYLIAQPYAAVRADLEKGLSGPGLGGFQPREDTAPVSAMEFYWAQVAASHLPDVKRALDSQASHTADPVLDQALAAGAITAGERDTFRAAIARQPEYADEAIKSLPFFSQPVARWSFERQREKASRTQVDYGTVMDVSALTGRAPLTLLWYGGAATTVTRHFRMTSCMVGVACFPDPHIERSAKTEEHADPALDSYVASLTQRLQALPPADADQIMQAYFDAYARGRAAASPPAAAPLATLPETTLQGISLPADESDLRRYDNDSWRLVALPDGSLLASGSATHRYVPRSAAAKPGIAPTAPDATSAARAAPDIAADAIDRQNGPAGMGFAGLLKVGADGQVWGLGMREDGLRQLLNWRPGQRQAVAVPLDASMPDRRIDDWTLTARGGVALRVGDTFFTMTPQGRWTQRHWDASLRRKASDTLENALPWLYGDAIAFGDGLFWATDRDGYGIDPVTARVSASFPTRSNKLFFGSRRGNWALAIAETPEGRRLRAIDLATGQARFDLETPAVYYTSSAARSAHGRLLAVSGADNTVVVLDMAENKLLLNLRAPKDTSVSAMAFSWKGDTLWIYARPVGNNGAAQLIAWDVPAGLRDAAQGQDIPDQLRCGYSMECR